MSNDNDTIEQVCADLRGHDLVPPPHGAWVIYANRIRDVYDRERRAWDAAIVDQRSVNKKLTDELASKDAEIAELHNMIEELADALHPFREWFGNQKLIDRAKEMVGLKEKGDMT